MLFNGKYYNKPGHLGMTTEELKEALAGGGSLYIVTINYNSDEELVTDKPYDEIDTAYNSGKKIIFYDMTSKNICNIMSYSSNGFRVQYTQITRDESSIAIDVTTDIIKPDGTIERTYYTGTVSATFDD